MGLLSFFSSGVSFDPKKDIPSLKGKVILVTGGNSGLGKQSILELARHEPAQIWLAARSPTKAQAAIDEIKKEVPDAPIQSLELDLTSFESIKKAARTFTAASDRLDILMLNAGIMATPAGLTKEGYEIQFGTNHVGHALLTQLLLPTLLRTADQVPGADVRVIVRSSKGVELAPAAGIYFDKVRGLCEDMATWNRYGQSKLANALFARELARHQPKLTVVAVHPGAVATNLAEPLMASYPILRLAAPLFFLIAKSASAGALNQLWASVVTEGLKSGELYFPVGIPGQGGALVRDDELARKLWDWTEEQLKGQKM